MPKFNAERARQIGRTLAREVDALGGDIESLYQALTVLDEVDDRFLFYFMIGFRQVAVCEKEVVDDPGVSC